MISPSVGDHTCWIKTDSDAKGEQAPWTLLNRPHKDTCPPLSLLTGFPCRKASRSDIEVSASMVVLRAAVLDFATEDVNGSAVVVGAG